MSTNVSPPTNDGSSSSPSYPQQAQNTGSLYSFSVHQPYTNWPLHTPHTTPYAPSWYSHPTHHYKSYRQQGAQTGEGLAKPSNEDQESGSKFAKQWDAVLVTFLKRVGLQQTLAGFHDDMLFLNEEWEREQVPKALLALVKDISELTEGEKSALPKKSLKERKLRHIRFQKDVEAQTPPSTVKSVSRLLRQSRKRNGTSNCAEFLLTTAEKRRRLNELGEPSSPREASKEPAGRQDTGNMDVNTSIPSCARVDAKYQDRDIQIKYDIAKNEDGPLRRTMKRTADGGESSAKQTRASLPIQSDEIHEPDAKSHPGLTHRMETVEDHLAVRYVPSPPRSLLDRLRFLEDYIIRRERDFPPWAALHFNQPNRGWPPPPRSTPIIVPPHLASSDSSSPSETATTMQGRSTGHANALTPGQHSSSKSGGGSKAKSSLHRAVLERLEIQRAIGDLAGPGPASPAGS